MSFITDKYKEARIGVTGFETQGRPGGRWDVCDPGSNDRAVFETLVIRGNGHSFN